MEQVVAVGSRFVLVRQTGLRWRGEKNQVELVRTVEG